MDQSNTILGNAPNAEQGVATVRIPSTVTTKGLLFELYSKSLKFPDYFGSNWDAFEECINDLDWLGAKAVLIMHEDFVKLPDDDFQVYIDVLRKSVAYWRTKGNKRLVVIFGSD
jgi:hypothetical protein